MESAAARFVITLSAAVRVPEADGVQVRFEDAKLRTLSSGMGIRLAFSIAIQTEPDIFIVDEALAVGDIEFQQKCLDKFREFKRQGKSIVVISHNMSVTNSFCEKGLYLLNGEPRAFRPSHEATKQYLEDIRATPTSARSQQSLGAS